MVACDGNCASLRPSEVALVLLCTYLDSAFNRLDANADATIFTNAIPGSSNISTPEIPRQIFRPLELQKICEVMSKGFLLFIQFLQYIY